MSGGRYDYVYRRIEELAEEIAVSTPLRRAFKTHLLKVAKACYDVERVDSHDCRAGDEDAAIMDCLGMGGPRLVLDEALEQARRVKAQLDAAIEAMGA